ncbi:MAG TPA: AMP-dependent synthetase, partial [Polyangiaceae bacterium]|nr:AMP-dependent synthetase [Polyangiaceae bacterium]
MNPTLVHQMLEGTAERLPEQLLVIEPKERHDYASMNAAANHLAATLLSRGMRPGDHVALLARNSAFYVEAYYGVLKAGGVVVALNTASDEHMLVDYLRMSRATTLIVGPGMERLVKRAAATIDEARLPALKLLVSPHADELGVTSTSAWCYARAETSEGPGVSVDPNDLAAIVFTSGSTGRPRGAMLTHGNIVANVTSIVRYLELTADDRVLQVLPFYYVYGKSVLNTHVMVGGTVVVENRFRYPKVALDTLEQERCTGLSGVPSTFAILLDRAGLAERELGSLRYVTQAGGAMSPALTRQLMEALPDTRIYVMYGATEA